MQGSVDLAIVGGGAAGLFAAATAVKYGVKCVVFERKARIGAKMLMTANGRCNFTKAIPVSRMLADLGEATARFVRQALEACPPDFIARGFEARGLRIKRMTDGRLFPASEKATDVVHIFGDLLRDKEVPLLVNCPVTGIHPLRDVFAVTTKNFTLNARHVLIATGGFSFPKTGSVGDGQRFAQSLGIRCVSPRAGLTGFETRAAEVRALCGRCWETGAICAVVDSANRECFRSMGEVTFESWGISGAAVYNAQRYLVHQGKAFMDWKLVLMHDGKHLELKNLVARPLKEAIVTIGGVALSEINPETMEARSIPGLYFAGEVLDIDGPTGGYNLTLAFATAHCAVCALVAKYGNLASRKQKHNYSR